MYPDENSTMTLDEVREVFGELVLAVLNDAKGNARTVAALRGIALYDDEKDAAIAAHSQFDMLEGAIGKLPLFSERFGSTESRRIALQLVYSYLATADSTDLQLQIVGSVWKDFLVELEASDWTNCSISNLSYFDSEEPLIDLGDGLSIRERDRTALLGLGFSARILDRLDVDWGGLGASRYVLVTHSSTPKGPKNVVLKDCSDPWLRCARAIGSLRLIAPGDVGMNLVFVERVARFNVGFGGIAATGASSERFGCNYSWTDRLHRPYEETYVHLKRLETVRYGNSPGNLDLALRSFMSSYDRIPSGADSRLVDAITALEAVLGTESEISFKLAFRVASLLANSDEERSNLLKSFRNFYDVRSRLVHGGRLGTKHKALLDSVDDLRDIVRRILRGFVAYAANATTSSGANPFKEDLDAKLVNTIRRDELRSLLGLAEIQTGLVGSA